MKGSYILLIKLDQEKNIKIGKRGLIKFQLGYYVYVGSALNSLNRRINRHLNTLKKIHWHIDYLLTEAKIVDVFYSESNEREECKIANIFYKNLVSINGFGCSDCKCDSHLFYGNLENIHHLIDFLDLKKYSNNANL